MKKVLVCSENPAHAAFFGNAVERHLWVLDKYGEFISDSECYDSEVVIDGVFTCKTCGADAKWASTSENGFLAGTVGYWLDESNTIFCAGDFDEYHDLQALEIASPVGSAIVKLLQDLHNLWANDDVPNDCGALSEAREHLIAAGVIQARVWCYG